MLGVLHALMEHDLKRLLAYHTVENIGIIFIGLGLALAFRANDMLGASGGGNDRGTVPRIQPFGLQEPAVLRCRVRSSRRPVSATWSVWAGSFAACRLTAFAFLIGSAAISALPPFNGFVSEWLTFQAILLSPQLPQWVLKFLAPAVGGLLALSAALAAACFVKAFGITFLGRARTSAAKDAREVDMLFVDDDVRVGLPVPCRRYPARLFHRRTGSGNPNVGRRASAATGVNAMVHDRSHRRKPQFLQRTAAIHSDCGRCVTGDVCHPSLGIARDTPRSAPGTADFQTRIQRRNIPAGSFAQPIRRVFGTLVFHAREEIDMPAPGDLATCATARPSSGPRLGRAVCARCEMRQRRAPMVSIGCNS